MPDFETTFDDAALCYERQRPDYPRALYDDLLAYLPKGGRRDALEIGAGTGKATAPILDAGFRVTALEPGERLARLAAAKLGGCPGFALRGCTLQDFECPAASFDLAYAATAFHWVPEAYGYRRVHELLRPGGAFARFCYHAREDREHQALWDDVQEVYRRWMPGAGRPLDNDREEARRIAELARGYGFADTKYFLYRMDKRFTADAYIELLRTYPDHMRLPAPDREALFAGVREAIMGHGGEITVRYVVDMELARKEGEA